VPTSVSETAAAGSSPAADVAQSRAFTVRAALIGLLCTWAVIVFIHWAELVLGGTRGHTALANTSIPVGPFFALFLVVSVNLLVRKLRPKAALSQRELIFIYALTAASSVVASSGGIHFQVPTITALFHFATPENNWEELFGFVPAWFAPRDREVIEAFYEGGAALPWRAWVLPVLAWSGFYLVFGVVTLSLSTLVREQWINRERLTFPTVYVPLGMTEQPPQFWKSKVMWAGFALPFLIGTLNTLHENYPVIPKLEVRNLDVSGSLSGYPWSALRPISLSFYPFIIGIAYILATDVTFSGVFFYWFNKGQYFLGATTGLNDWGSGLNYSKFPFIEFQGAGAFLALTGFTLWAGRHHFGSILRAARGSLRTGERPPEGEPVTWAVWGLVGGLGALVLFCVVGGMRWWPPLLILVLSLAYLLAAARIRAESGNAWLFGPRVDPNLLMISALGTRAFRLEDLTLLCYISNISSFDLRCVAMPHQLDGYKMADEVGLSKNRLTSFLLLGLATGLMVAFWVALGIWYRLGALAKLDHWRTLMGRAPFDRLEGYINHPSSPDALGLSFLSGGLLLTVFLIFMRTRFMWWPLHPVGYAMAATLTMGKMWVPFSVAWVVKTLVLRYGGAKLYQRSLPFFLGLIVGDFFNGGLWTAVGCVVSSWHVYPVNW